MKKKRKPQADTLEKAKAAPAPKRRLSRRNWLFALAGVAGMGVAGFWLVKQVLGHVPEHGYEIVNRYPHREDAFTQGLVYADGFLWEGTGGHGTSFLRKVNLETGEPEQESDRLNQFFFGEGIALWNDTIVQLTWKSGIGFVYEKENFRRVRNFPIRGEGWGLTHDGRRLIMSDGTDKIRFLNPETLAEEGERLKVCAGGQPVPFLNELEYINGEIYANVFQTDNIVRIAPDSGEVTARLNLAGLRPMQTRGDDNRVLNGIAWDAEDRRLFVTGKEWPTLFEIREVTPS